MTEVASQVPQDDDEIEQQHLYHVMLFYRTLNDGRLDGLDGREKIFR